MKTTINVNLHCCCLVAWLKAVMLGRSIGRNRDRNVAGVASENRVVEIMMMKIHHRVPLWIVVCALVVAIDQGRNIAQGEIKIGITVMIIVTIKIDNTTMIVASMMIAISINRPSSGTNVNLKSS